MNDEQHEDLKKRAYDQLKEFLKLPVISNDNPIWVMECARVLGPSFAFVSYKKINQVSNYANYEILLSSKRLAELYDRLFSCEKNFYERSFLFDDVNRQICEARLRCEAIISAFELKESDDLKSQKEKLELEADIKSRYRR